jgi:predicted kinase
MIAGLAFVVIRGPRFAGKTTLARHLAARLRDKAGLISQDDLWWRWIVRHDHNLGAEAALVYRAMKLLASSYIRGRYHVVVEGPFAVEQEGVVALHDSDLRDLLGLVSTIPAVRPLLGAVTAPLETLTARAEEAGVDARTATAWHRAFAEAVLPVACTIDTAVLSPDEAVDLIFEHLGARL